jgi:endonuclease-3
MNGVIDGPMATTINKQKILNLLLSATRKSSEAGTEDRPVLEQLIYSLCRENATPEQARQAFCFLREHFFDWNEIRVSSQRELEEAFRGEPNPEVRAQRLVMFLQEVFETTYSFDLDGLLKKGLKQGAKHLSRFQAANDYSIAWVVQRSLGGHAIPVDAPTLRTTRRLGLIETESESEARSSLEHLIPKAKGPHFTDAISRIADEYCQDEEPRCGECPLAGECAYAHEVGVETVASVRSRPKPR